jgi:hypothetical protein
LEHYDLGNVDVLRERLTRARTYAKSLPTTPKVTPLGSRRQAGDTAREQRVAG